MSNTKIVLLKVKNGKVRKIRKDGKEPLLVNCWICDFLFKVKYVFSTKRYSLKNNWGFWTGKEIDKKKYFCNNCLVKILDTEWINHWVEDENKASTFRTYFYRGQFGRKMFQKKTNLAT